MKKSLLATIALVAVTVGGAASAADMAIKADSRARCGQFGGWYVGGNVGWAYQDSKWVDRDNWIDNFSNDFNSSAPSTDRNGVNVGGVAGYNWQSGCTVFGVEIDANWADLSGSKSYSPAAPPATTLTIDDTLHWWGTARLRTGIVVDNLMVFVTGGFAYANIKHSWTVVDTAIPATEAFSAGNDRWGGVIGVGTEWAMNEKWSVKSEFLYIRFAEDQTSGFSPAGGQTVRFDSQDSMLVSRIGLSYRWGGR